MIQQEGNEVTFQVKVNLKGILMDMEGAILEAVNELGCVATEEALKIFYTLGTPIQLGDVRMSYKGQVPKRYETPYGAIDLSRHVY